ncbi:hypothetical protein B0H17DRAFT_44180 [Mycena rosella]|uniref:Uncharacterized protein n=1 Tax=Mycena rosella TaxID=1033263 RepID=A0AAD7GCU4_MYCRO|nr:hypothetical protein B0H17DRAFT_44180 [Mycena rosella]
MPPNFTLFKPFSFKPTFSFSISTSSTSFLRTHPLARRFAGLRIPSKTSNDKDDDSAHGRRTSRSRPRSKPFRQRRQELTAKRIHILSAPIIPPTRHGPVIVTFFTTDEERQAKARWNARCDAARSDLSIHAPRRDFSLLSSPADINDQGTWRKLCGLPWPSAIPASSKGVLSSGAQFCRHTVVKRGAALKPGRKAKRDTLKLGLVKRRRALLSRKSPPSGVQPAALVHPPLAKPFGLPWPSAIPASSKGVMSSGAQFCRHTVVKRGAALKPGRKAKRDTLKIGLVIRRRALLSRRSPPSVVQPVAVVYPPPAYAPPAPVPVPMPVPSLPLQNVTNNIVVIKKGTKKKGRMMSARDGGGGDGKHIGSGSDKAGGVKRTPKTASGRENVPFRSTVGREISSVLRR